MSAINIKYLVALLAFSLSFFTNAFGQSKEAEQLLLNVEKLAQLKNILTDMKKGYTIISSGYNAVKNISRGNFSLHEAFLGGLMMVSTEVRKYTRVADIITAQMDLVKECKRSLKNFQSSGLMNAEELDYLSRVYGGLFSQIMDNLDELTLVLSAGSLRMSDQERLSAIDRIFKESSDKLVFLRSFNRQTGILLLQRKGSMADIKGIRGLFKIN